MSFNEPTPSVRHVAQMRERTIDPDNWIDCETCGGGGVNCGNQYGFGKEWVCGDCDGSGGHEGVFLCQGCDAIRDKADEFYCDECECVSTTYLTRS